MNTIKSVRLASCPEPEPEIVTEAEKAEERGHKYKVIKEMIKETLPWVIIGSIFGVLLGQFLISALEHHIP